MKLFRGFRQQLIHEKNIKKYLLYAIGEILLVMIGILLAFQVDNWNEDRVKKVAEIRTYRNLREQIVGDKELIKNQIDYNNRYMVQFGYAKEIILSNDRSKIDTLGAIAAKLTSYSDFDRKGNIYETMVNSGEIQLLQNQSIINRIRWLEERYNYINRMENIHYDIVIGYVAPNITTTVNFITTEVIEPEQIYSVEFQNLIHILLQVMIEKDEVYKSGIAEIDEILALIDTELKDN